MVDIWSNWRRFPNAHRGELLQAPIGPGVYEVRHALTGRVVAFGHAANVAIALTGLVHDGPRPLWQRLLRRALRQAEIKHRSGELEYRTVAATNRDEARVVALRLQQSRYLMFRRRWNPLWA